MPLPGSAVLLQFDDRCGRAGFYAQRWERLKVRPLEALYLAIEEGLTDEGGGDPGQVAGDAIMTLAADRGIDSKNDDLFGNANHLAHLADMITYVLRTGSPWERPEDTVVGKEPWTSSVFLRPGGTGLRRVILADHWTANRAESEANSWRSRGEAVAYRLPSITQVVVVIGQNRGERYHSPWTKAWRHPVNSQLRMRKRSGEHFGGSWKPTFREELQEVDRQVWLDTMTADGVLPECLFEVQTDPPEKAEYDHLLREKLSELRSRQAPPRRHLSQCHWPSPCPYSSVCPSFIEPSVRNGFVKLG